MLTEMEYKFIREWDRVYGNPPINSILERKILNWASTINQEKLKRLVK
jgi:hypothetical protein